ncbi:hypothetical protein ACHAWF_009784 [Thalassiosira exigua]
MVYAHAAALRRRTTYICITAATHECYSALENFKPQELSNMVWAIVAHDHLGTFKPQALSNILLAYSKSDAPNPRLYHKVANYIVGLHDLRDFKPRELSNTMCTFAKVAESNPRLFLKVANHISGLNHMNLFNSQDIGICKGPGVKSKTFQENG